MHFGRVVLGLNARLGKASLQCVERDGAWRKRVARPAKRHWAAGVRRHSRQVARAVLIERSERTHGALQLGRLHKRNAVLRHKNTTLGEQRLDVTVKSVGEKNLAIKIKK